MTIIIIVGRISAVWISHGLFSLCAKEKDITLKELVFISYGGMIRGAIAFGLVLKIPDGSDFKERSCIITTTLAVVIITTVVFGTFMPVIQKALFPPMKENVDKALDKPKKSDLAEHLVETYEGSPGKLSRRDPHAITALSEIGQPIQENEHEHTDSMTIKKKSEISTYSDADGQLLGSETHYGSIKHPNMELSEADKSDLKNGNPQRKRRNSNDANYDKDCIYYFFKLD